MQLDRRATFWNRGGTKRKKAAKRSNPTLKFVFLYPKTSSNTSPVTAHAACGTPQTLTHSRSLNFGQLQTQANP